MEPLIVGLPVSSTLCILACVIYVVNLRFILTRVLYVVYVCTICCRLTSALHELYTCCILTCVLYIVYVRFVLTYVMFGMYICMLYIALYVHCICCIYVMIALRTIFAVHVLYFYLYALFDVRML